MSFMPACAGLDDSRLAATESARVSALAACRATNYGSSRTPDQDAAEIGSRTHRRAWRSKTLSTNRNSRRKRDQEAIRIAITVGRRDQDEIRGHRKSARHVTAGIVCRAEMWIGKPDQGRAASARIGDRETG